jgi:heterodisulfide reductase subunit B
MKFGYYPGCSLSGTAKEFDLSIRQVVKALNIDFDEINDWSCCGASSAHGTNHLLSVALPARNLLLAEKQGFDVVMAPCAACFNRLAVSRHELNADISLKNKTEELLEEKINDMPRVINLIQFFNETGIDKIKEKITVSLKGLNAACYYGCLLLRPSNIINFDDAEDPSSMEEIISALGANPVKWNFKTECCGAAHSIPHTGIVEKLGKNIIDDAVKNGADIIVTACPMCHSNLDMRQLNIIKHNAGQKSIPVIYLSQLAGIAMGINYSKLGMDLHYINPLPVIKSKTSAIQTAEAAV